MSWIVFFLVLIAMFLFGLVVGMGIQVGMACKRLKRDGETYIGECFVRLVEVEGSDWKAAEE